MPVGAAGRSAVSAVIVALMVTAGCEGGAVEVPSSPTPSSTSAPAPARGAEVAAPAAATTVLDAAPGAESAIATSAALFRNAPVVLVATEGDAAGTRTLSAVATRVGAPALLAPPIDDPQRTPNAAGDTALRRELDRLSPDAVLAVGPDAAGSARALGGGVPVFDAAGAADGRAATPELPAGLPATKPPRRLDLTVLVDAARDDAAAVATARAVGATVLTVAGSDPRADPKTVAALHKAGPRTVLAVGGAFGPAERLRARLNVAAGGAQLPGGGQVLLPGRRIVCLYGHPGAPSLGVLGEQGADASVVRAKRMAAAYRHLSDVPVVPAFEIIATVAQAAPGPDGNYSAESSVASLRPWVDKARKAGLYVLLDLQPGRANLLTQARRYESLLRLPHVGLAVDPEWKLGPRQRPLEQIGGIDAAELNRTSAWLAGLTARHALPQKLYVIHQFRLSMIRHEAALRTTHDELTTLIHMDGQGSTAQKNSTWRSVVAARPRDLPLGWKNFYDEDHPMLTPRQTMAKRPAPAMISYQ